MLKQRATKAIAWNGLDLMVQHGLGFVISVVMARLVAPEAYGTIALLFLFTGIAGAFVDGGMAAALIQKKETSRLEESTVFWFNLAAGLVMGAVLFLAAPLIARFYDLPLLIPITRLVSLQFFFGACNSVQRTLFTKHLNFKTPMKIAAAATLLSAGVGIALAWHDFGVWALVAQSLTNAFLNTVFLWAFSPWRPLPQFSRDAFRRLFSFGGWMFLSRLLDTGYTNIYTLIIGRLFGVHDLGIYNRAQTTKQLPTSVLTGVLSRVAFPVFSQAADDLPKLRRGFRLSIRGIMFINIPVMLGVAVVAEPLILSLFGPAWKEAVPYLRILAVGGVLWPLHVLNLSVLQALGHSRLFFRIEIIKKCTGIALLCVGAQFGMLGLAYATVASSIFAFAYNAYYSGRLLDYGAWQQTVDFAPASMCGLVMVGAVAGVGLLFNLAPIPQLLTLSLLGAGVYFALASLLRVPELREARELVKTFRRP